MKLTFEKLSNTDLCNSINKLQKIKKGYIAIPIEPLNAVMNGIMMSTTALTKKSNDNVVMCVIIESGKDIQYAYVNIEYTPKISLYECCKYLQLDDSVAMELSNYDAYCVDEKSIQMLL